MDTFVDDFEVQAAQQWDFEIEARRWDWLTAAGCSDVTSWTAAAPLEVPREDVYADLQAAREEAAIRERVACADALVRKEDESSNTPPQRRKLRARRAPAQPRVRMPRPNKKTKAALAAKQLALTRASDFVNTAFQAAEGQLRAENVDVSPVSRYLSDSVASSAAAAVSPLPLALPPVTVLETLQSARTAAADGALQELQRVCVVPPPAPAPAPAPPVHQVCLPAWPLEIVPAAPPAVSNMVHRYMSTGIHPITEFDKHFVARFQVARNTKKDFIFTRNLAELAPSAIESLAVMLLPLPAPSVREEVRSYIERERTRFVFQVQNMQPRAWEGCSVVSPFGYKTFPRDVTRLTPLYSLQYMERGSATVITRTFLRVIMPAARVCVHLGLYPRSVTAALFNIPLFIGYLQPVDNPQPNEWVMAIFDTEDRAFLPRSDTTEIGPAMVATLLGRPVVLPALMYKTQLCTREVQLPFDLLSVDFLYSVPPEQLPLHMLRASLRLPEIALGGK